MSFELFRRIAHDAITTPDLVPETARPDPAVPASREQPVRHSTA